MRKSFLCLICSLLGIFSIFSVELYAISTRTSISAYASAQSEIAMEMRSGTVLTENNADAMLPMASTTKILTAIIIIEDCNLDEVITVPDEAVGAEGSSIYLKKDEKLDIRDLLYGLMLRSGNDSAVALAIHHSGSVQKFAVVMNERARSMGAKNSNFTNPSGLPDEEHYTTARDLCTIACYAMDNATFREIVSSTNYTGKYRSYANKNKMLRLYEGANGVKTGYTMRAGRCLVSSAERNGMDVVCVVLNCPDMYERSCAIFDKCFDDFELLKIDTDKVFMCNKVLCKLKNICSIIVEKSSEIDYNVVPNEINDSENGVARLEIYNRNKLIFSEKLYSI